MSYQKRQAISLLLGVGVSVILVIYLSQQIDYPHFFRLAKNVPRWAFYTLLSGANEHYVGVIGFRPIDAPSECKTEGCSVKSTPSELISCPIPSGFS